MRRVARCCGVVLALAWPVGVVAQPEVRIARIDAAFADWLATQDTDGTGAVLWPAAPGPARLGPVDAEAPVAWASVSKMVTGLCVARLLDEGILDDADTVVSVLGRGPEVKVTALLTHTSGYEVDVTQALMFLWLDTPEHRAEDVVDRAGLPTGASGVYRYNNVNYAMLGAMVEAATGQPYAEACHARAIAPSGAAVTPSPAARAFLSWGGWQATAADFARFHAYWFGPDGVYGADPFAQPHAEIVPDVYYGLGTFFRDSPAGFNFWHHGALCFGRRLQASSFAVTWHTGWTVAVAYDGCAARDGMIALDQVLTQAAFGALE